TVGVLQLGQPFPENYFAGMEFTHIGEQGLKEIPYILLNFTNMTQIIRVSRLFPVLVYIINHILSNFFVRSFVSFFSYTGNIPVIGQLHPVNTFETIHFHFLLFFTLQNKKRANSHYWLF